MKVNVSLLFFFFFTLASQAQQVAVVLSGGGAKGIAHVGALKILEKEGIPIDYIMGTSMGGVIAANYAAGYSPEQIEEVLLSPDFQGWVNGNLGDRYNYFYTSKDPNASWLTLDLSFDSTFNPTIQSKLASDKSLNFALATLLSDASWAAKNNFDSLMIPYRAVLAEVFTQQVAIPKKGILPDVVRGTLSVPFFYRPIQIDEKFYFDGGIYANFPIQQARETFDPDIIIGINVAEKKFSSYPYDQDEELISEYMMYMLLDKSDPTSLIEDGFYIEPDVREYSAFDFDQVTPLIAAGEDAARRSIDAIKSRLARLKNNNLLQKEREAFNLKKPDYRFHEITFSGLKKSQQKYISSLFQRKGKDLYQFDDVRKGYYRLISDPYFKDIYPRFLYDTTQNSYELSLTGNTNKYLSMQVGGNLSTKISSMFYLGLQFYHFNNFLINHDLQFYGGGFYKSLQYKMRMNFPSSVQFYIEPEFTVNEWDFLNSTDLLNRSRTPTIMDQVDRKAGAKIGIPLGTRFKGTLGAHYLSNNDFYSNSSTVVSNDTLDVLRFRGGRYSIALSRNSLNKKQFPNRGAFLRTTLDYFTGREIYTPGSTSEIPAEQTIDRAWFKWQLEAERYFFRFSPYRLGYYAHLVLSNQPFFSNYRGSLMNAPGFYPMIDSRNLFLENYRAYNFGALGIKNVFLINKNFEMRLEAYGFLPFQKIVNRDGLPALRAPDKIYPAGTLTSVYHTPVGPASLSLTYYDDQQDQWSVFLNFGYAIFNRKSTE